MTARKAVHYCDSLSNGSAVLEPTSRFPGDNACGYPRVLREGEWTNDPSQVTCGNCERTLIHQKALSEYVLVEHMTDSAKRKQDLASLARKARAAWPDLDPVRKHITGKPVRRPHYWIEVCGVKFHGMGEGVRR